jgi:hypothetical protein
MVSGSDEEGMKRTDKGRKPQYTWLVVYCLGELYMNELRSLKNKQPIIGFTQTEIHDCVKEYIDIKNPTIIKNAIYDAIAHGWAAAVKAHKHGRSLFVPTKSGLVLYIVIDEILFGSYLLALYQTSSSKDKEEAKRVLAYFRLVLDSLISELSLYEILARYSSSFEHWRIARGLDLLRETRDALIGYNKEIPTSIETRRLYNMVKYLIKIFEMMKVSGIGVLCNAVDYIINGLDPLVWSENVLG